MKYLPNSPFHGLVPAEAVLAQEGYLVRELVDLSQRAILIEFSDREQDRSVLPELVRLISTYSQINWYVLVGSDRNLAGFRGLAEHGIQIGAYVPTDELIYKCPYLQRSINFGAQIDLLRRLFILVGQSFALCDPSAIQDVDHYLEMTGSLAHNLYPIRYTTGFDEMVSKFNRIKRD